MTREIRRLPFQSKANDALRAARTAESFAFEIREVLKGHPPVAARDERANLPFELEVVITA